MTPRKNASKKALADRTFLNRIDLGTENRFSSKDWEKVKKHFKERCVYCGKKEGNGVKLEKDHAIPLNRQWLGLSRSGNIVPACQKCNSEKSDRHFVRFCRRQAIKGREAESAIKEYMKKIGGKYRLGKNEEERKKIRKEMDKARELAAEIRDNAVESIKEIVTKKKAKKTSTKK